MGGEGVPECLDVIVEKHGNAVDVGGEGCAEFAITRFVQVDGRVTGILKEAAHASTNRGLADHQDPLCRAHGSESTGPIRTMRALRSSEVRSPHVPPELRSWAA